MSLRRIVTNAIGIVLLLFGVLLVVAVVSHSAWFHGKLPPDTLPTTASQAEDVAFSVASNADCGDFDSEYAFRDPWMFECTIGDVSFQIFVYGSDQSRSADLARLQADDRPYVTKAYYAVTAPQGGVDKFAAMSATPPPQSIMDPFR